MLSPNDSYIQAGSSQKIDISEVGYTTSGYEWTLTGATKSGARLAKTGSGALAPYTLYCDANEPSNTELTVTVTRLLPAH